MDLWMGPLTAVSAVIPCEDELSDDTYSSKVWLNPSSTEKVDTTKFFDKSRSENKGCIKPTEVCHDVGTECGNTCEIPNAASC